MRVALVLAALGAGLLMLIALVWWSPPGGDAAPPATATEGAPPPSDEIRALRAELDGERRARAELADEVAHLRLELAHLAHGSPVPPPPPAESAGESSADPAESAVPDGAPAVPRGRRFPLRGGFAEPALVALGVPAEDAARLRERFEALELEELYLRDGARREGSFGGPRYAESLRQLREDLRAEVGDESYDRMLYAAGRRNRIELAQILANSPAERAGLRAGDIVLRYGDVAIFDGVGLQQATSRAEAGSSVALDVLRGDEEVRLYLPGGPVGARLRPVRREPDVRW